jgi:hypothetical protein
MSPPIVEALLLATQEAENLLRTHLSAHPLDTAFITTSPTHHPQLVIRGSASRNSASCSIITVPRRRGRPEELSLAPDGTIAMWSPVLWCSLVPNPVSPGFSLGSFAPTCPFVEYKFLVPSELIAGFYTIRLPG